MAENLNVKKSPVECILECPLCLHQLQLPQTLQQCLHSYCKSCLYKVPQKTQDGKQGWLCPMCENFTNCDQIQHNTFIEQLQKIHSEPKKDDTIKCEQCLDDCGEAKWKCAECKIGLCENGKALHFKIPMLKGHKMLPLESDGEMLIDNVVFCKVHEDIPTQLNCCDCDQLICYKCNAADHKGHAAETIEETLERIIPETESSARQVNENISIMEAQIEGIKKEMEQTKESYASCRMQMDDHLEKVICRMRAMKAQMEEDVNEQESIALDVLKEHQQQLEKQLSQAIVISNLTTVVTTKMKNTSQLQQLQNGLFEKVKSAGEVKNQSIFLNLPTVKFIEGQRFQEQSYMVFGELGFDITEQIISISGGSYSKPIPFLCSDFMELAKTQLQKDKEIVVNTDWCNQLSYIDNKIWLPLDSRKKINIYDDEGELIDVIDTGDKRISVVKAAYNGDLICAGVSGLFVAHAQFSKWTRLSDGKFSDVVIDKDQFLALQYDEPSVHTFSSLKARSDRQESIWGECQLFRLTEDVKVDSNSIICSVAEQYLLISSSSAAKGLFTLTWGGEHVDSCNNLRCFPVICGTDKNNHVLVAAFGSGTMYLFKPLSEESIQRRAVLSVIKTHKTRSVVIDNNNNLWILAGKPYKLIKYAPDK